MRTDWLHGTELPGEEEALACRGLVGGEVATVLVGEEEVEEDLKGTSLVGEGVEGGGADTFVPSPGKLTWETGLPPFMATYGPILYLLSPWKHDRMGLSERHTDSVVLFFCYELHSANKSL